MARNMIGANETIFKLLDDYVGNSGYRLESEGQRRWIITSDDEKDILKNYATKKIRKFSPSIAIGRFDKGRESLWVLAGFSQETASSYCVADEVCAGVFTCAISEIAPRPSASVDQIREVVDAGDARFTDYDGHLFVQLAQLFPKLKVYVGSDIAQEDTDRVFFEFALFESQYTGSWVSDKLRKELHHLHKLDLIEVPYYLLSKAIFDFDPASLFMALYRCLEMLYSYAAADRLRADLAIVGDWRKVAASLEDQIGWRPAEASSLTSLMTKCGETDLECIVSCIDKIFPSDSKKGIADRASASIYRLRNSIVHFRPAHSYVNHEELDWDELCCAVANAVAYVYSDIFECL